MTKILILGAIIAIVIVNMDKMVVDASNATDTDEVIHLEYDHGDDYCCEFCCCYTVCGLRLDDPPDIQVSNHFSRDDVTCEECSSD